MRTQLAFALDRVKTLAPQHPEWKNTQPFKAVLDGDMEDARGVRRKGPGGTHHGHACRE